MDFELIGEISDVETIAVNLTIRENADLKARHGGRRWRKLKASARSTCLAAVSVGRNSTGMSHTASASER